MLVPPAVIVHGLADARVALAPGLPVTLLSAPGAALYGGCGWWRALVLAARGLAPDAGVTDILDCADVSGEAMAALRIGITRLVLWPSASGWSAVADIAAGMGGFVWSAAPPALDLAQPGASRRVLTWLDTGPALGHP